MSVSFSASSFSESFHGEGGEGAGTGNFSGGSFSGAVGGFSLDAEAQSPAQTPQAPIGGGIPYDPPPRTRRQISEARKRFGLEDTYEQERAAQVIASVAARQAQALETDHYKQYEELTRQLDIEGLEFDRRYLEALSQQRERLIDKEIFLQFRRIEEEELMLLVMIAASSI